ncbi:hypothetical protein HG535_0G02140 [Zygotorulaspora mrakii]|uniref:Inner kinetochore subunit AME1 domain-containing protein n=1 Tax=Zygotorulaspora mrakii TaxID=42260 RepID=A0A7H9B716_ZYGMR|nr:uncharacterized protein HG535_0G02140 [Zygotorulaspora mrakii]QLG74330.1 hypothetical protein HG535_0G02140 [Zygotorulaspora mrakii]
MSFNLTDRGIKLLYRQRGSNLRKLDPDDDDLVIRGPSMQDAPSDIAPSVYEPADNEVPDADPLELDGPADEKPLRYEIYSDDIQENGGDDFGEEEGNAQGAVNTHENYNDIDESTAYYNFQDMPLRQLSSSITSITSIDVLVSMFTNLFQHDLIPQAMNVFEQTGERRLKMLYKLDVRIFETVLDQLVKDFKDILDINMSNNELCYQLRQLVSVREDLNEQLVAVRKELQSLKCGGELYQAQQESEILDGRVELNDKLNDLTEIIVGHSPIPPAASLTKVDEFCNNINPYSGIATKIERMNETLKSMESTHQEL